VAQTVAAGLHPEDQRRHLSQKPRPANAEDVVNSGIDKKCGAVANLAVLFDCNGAATSDQLALCVIAAAEGEACRALEQADELSLTCKSDPAP
jgi:hypothetical protein